MKLHELYDQLTSGDEDDPRRNRRSDARRSSIFVNFRQLSSIDVSVANSSLRTSVQ